MTSNIFPNKFKITQADRIRMLKQKPFLLWFTGLSGSGKSTLASRTETVLYQRGYKTYLLDGDNLRSGLNKDLSFSTEGRIENLRRVGEVSKLMMDAGLIVIAAFISPFENERQMIREMVGKGNFIEVYVDCPLEVCEKRDVKGLYEKARSGVLKNFTGIDSPYEPPKNPQIHIGTDMKTIKDSLDMIINYLEDFVLGK